MPKLPKGLYRKGKAYYCRKRIAGKDTWIPLGSELETARRRLREVQRQPVVGRHINVSALADRWLDCYCTPTLVPYGTKQVQGRIEKHLKPFFGCLPVQRLSGDTIRSYRLWLERKGLAPVTVAHVLADVRGMLYWAESEGYVVRSPFPRRVMPKVQEQPPDRLTDEEVERLLSLPDPYRWMVQLGLATGMRWSELQRAQSTDAADGMLAVYNTKSRRLRKVPLPPGLLVDRVGKLVPAFYPWTFTDRVRRLSGVAHFHPHQLRHTFACRWLEAGGSLAALQQILGHSSIVTTQRYARLSEEHVREQAKRVWGL